MLRKNFEITVKFSNFGKKFRFRTSTTYFKRNQCSGTPRYFGLSLYDNENDFYSPCTYERRTTYRSLSPTIPTEQCLNLAAKNYLCYVSWLRMCQLFTVLTGVIFQCWIAAVTGSGQVHMGARLMTHKILYQLAFRAKMIHLPSWWSWQKFEEIWEFILLASGICNIWAKRENSNVALWG